MKRVRGWFQVLWSVVRQRTRKPTPSIVPNVREGEIDSQEIDAQIARIRERWQAIRVEAQMRGILVEQETQR